MANKVICWNSAGIRASCKTTPAKIAYFDNKFPNANFAIAAFIETHHKNEDDFPEQLKLYKTTHNIIHSPTHTNETHGGIIIIISKEYDITKKQMIIPGRFINITVKQKSSKIELNLSVFYGPQWRHMNKNEIIAIIQKFHQTHKINDNNIIIGDFNFADNNIDKGKQMDSKDKVIYPHWEKFKSDNAIIDPYRIQYPKKLCYSFIAPTGKSRGDRLYVSEDQAKTITNIKYDYTPFNSAHKIMNFDIKITKEIGKGYWKMNSSVLKDEAYKREIEEAKRGIDEFNIANPIDRWDLIIMVIRSITKTYTQQKAKIQNNLKQNIITQMHNLEAIEQSKMTNIQKQEYLHLKQRYKEIIDKEIEGHQIRTRGHPRYEMNEPDIDFYAKLEKRSQQKNIINELQDENGDIKTDDEDLIRITEKYYTKLYTATKVNSVKQHHLLRNIKKKISAEDKNKLDAPITEEELLEAVMQLNDNKSPGLDGITAEFYKTYWYLLKDDYLQYINSAKTHSFGKHRNTSVTTIIYKYKGEIYQLSNYRPISLINVDLKILTKTLTNRIKVVLPTIIHESQTAVFGRRIDHTVHMIRDLIQLVDNEDSEAAFIFLDQEKAFDRVDHPFLFKTMEAFGIGKNFIDWVKILYSNASIQIKINGHLTSNIPLQRGVKQGCPLSFSLYVLVIEVLALQLRNNPNIVGFQVGGEKIVSMHYADDATITITQNRCFKEVIKDLHDYEQASGAKVNYDKTKGLWLGKWKDRTDTPLGIKWTNENVKTLGVYFGNDNPAEKTFDDILPKIINSMNYWKQFRLSAMAKARVIEIFHASRLWYAATFYNIAPSKIKMLQKKFVEYVNYPHTSLTISEQEMKKLRKHGGAKVIDIQTKTEASKIRWLMELATNPNLQIHMNIITTLIGHQKGSLTGLELFFITKQCARRTLRINTPFYKEAILAITKLNVKKKIEDLNLEKVFYNPTFQNAKNTTLPPNQTCLNNQIFTYGQILAEYNKQQNGQPCNRHVANIYPKIVHKDLDNRSEHTIFHTESQKCITFQQTTNKMIYEELLILEYKEHHSKAKWEERIPHSTINWNKVWESVHNPLSHEDTKTTIWEQIHLNDYTTYSYNKWHNAQQPCPFCQQLPSTKYHITIECPTLTQVWNELETHLVNIHPIQLTDTEKVFGLPGSTPNIILRNWMTYLFRQCIVEQENVAFHNQKGQLNAQEIKLEYNQRIKSEIWSKYNILSNLGREHYFQQIFGANDYLIVKVNDQWQLLTLFNIQ